MKDASDVIVVGGGPSGSFTALKLAEHGIDVTVYEEHDEIGIPSHCAGHLSIHVLRSLGLYPLPSGIVENTFRGAVFYSPCGNRFSVRLASPVTCVVNRALFDKHLAEKAQSAGAIFSLNSKVENLILENGIVKGVRVELRGRTEKKMAKIVVDAEGISPRILKETGLSGSDRRMLVNGVEAEAENVKDMSLDMVEVFLGAEYASGLYAWLIPKKDGRAKVGLAVRGRDPQKLLQKFVTEHPIAREKLHDARIARVSVHPISLGGPITKAYSSGFLAVGDAASHVKSTTGGGVVFGLTGAAIAAEIVCEAVRRDDCSSRFLSAYQRRLNDALGFDAKIMVRMRRTLDAMSDRRLDALVGMCTKLGLEKTLQKVGEIDFQGRTLLRILRSPRAFAAVGYSFLTYLFAKV
jgi:geranylgeranyl reductase family protein